MPKIIEQNTLSKRTKNEIVKDLIKEEKIEEDLISIYSAMLESGVAECLPLDFVSAFYKNLTTLRDESIIHQKMVEVILNKFQN